MRSLTLLIIITLALSTSSAFAKDDAEEQEIICVGGAHFWSGTQDELRKILTDPVPQSYKDSYYSQNPCKGLIIWSLADWHYRFGDENSAKKAIEFLIQGDTASLAITSPIAKELQRPWDKQWRQLQSLESSLKTKIAADDKKAIRKRDMAFYKLSRATEIRETYLYVAVNLLRAAEIYDSLILLDQAQKFRDLAMEADIFRSSLPQSFKNYNASTKWMFSDKGDIEWHRESVDFDQRHAVLKAEITRNPVDIDAATAMMRAAYFDVFDDVIENAEESIERFCYSDEEELTDEALALCDSSDELEELVLAWLMRFERLTMLMREDGTHYQFTVATLWRNQYQRRDSEDTSPQTMSYRGNSEYEIANLKRLLEADHGGDPNQPQSLFGFNFFAQLPYLDYLFAMAEHETRMVGQTRLQAFSNEEITYDAGNYFDVLHRYQFISQTIDPFDAPSLFHRAATGWLEAAKLLDAAELGKGWGDPFLHTETPRYIWFEHMLTHLDEYLLGADISTERRTE